MDTIPQPKHQLLCYRYMIKANSPGGKGLSQKVCRCQYEKIAEENTFLRILFYISWLTCAFVGFLILRLKNCLLLPRFSANCFLIAWVLTWACTLSIKFWAFFTLIRVFIALLRFVRWAAVSSLFGSPSMNLLSVPCRSRLCRVLVMWGSSSCTDVLRSWLRVVLYSRSFVCKKYKSGYEMAKRKKVG